MKKESSSNGLDSITESLKKKLKDYIHMGLAMLGLAKEKKIGS